MNMIQKIRIYPLIQPVQEEHLQARLANARLPLMGEEGPTSITFMTPEGFDLSFVKW